ncbi:MAG: SPOR domain-containing protein [Lachnospiraceae bacterium]|nr:SPOR domain-containing protein [Lachnospiraceae bacterium]
MRKTIATIIICLTSTLILAGCSGSTDGNLSDSTKSLKEEKPQEETQDEEKPEIKKTDGKEEKASGRKSLAQRMAGKYSYHHSTENGNEEFYIMDVVPFGDNLYAFCGQAMPEDYETLEAYTFWTSEFIPYDADEVKSTEGDTVTVNELRFSVMSNAGMYWDAGHKGKITLTDDGLVFEGFDNDGFLVPEDDNSRLFLKDDRIENAFSYLKNDDEDAPEELQGLWVHSEKDSDLYIEFAGSDMYMYIKDPDHEVIYAAAGCDFHDGSFDCTGNMIEQGGMPFDFSAGFKIEGDELALETEGSDTPYFLPEDGNYKRVSAGEVPVITMDEVELSSDSFGMFGGGQDLDVLKKQDYYGVFVSSAKSPEAFETTLDKLKEAGFAWSFTVYTPDFSGLNPEPYYTVTTGLYTSESDAKEALLEVKAAGYSDAYVKYAGSYIGNRYWYTMKGGEKIDVLKDGVMLRGVSVTIPYYTDTEVITDLLMTEDTVFDSSAELEFFGNYEKGDSPLEWIVRNYNLMHDDIDRYLTHGPALTGIFEVGLEGSTITSYYGSFWWD